MTAKKVWCSIVEAPVWSTRCLFKLCKVIEGNPTCEECILRQLERLKSVETNISDISFISSDIKVSKGAKGSSDRSGVSDGRIGKRRSKRGRKKRSRPLEGEALNQMYSAQELSQLLGKAERTVQEWAQKGKIPAVRIGIKWQFSKEEIDRWLSEKKGHTFGTPEPGGEELPEFQKGDFLSGNKGEPEKEA
jgi:excisionase family DNA binding protein